MKEKKRSCVVKQRSTTKKSRKDARESLKRSLRRPLQKRSSVKEKRVCISEQNYKSVDPKSRWVIVELSEETSLELNYEQIVHTIEDVLGDDAAFFIPLYVEKVQGKNASYVLFDGYVFVQRTDEVISKIFRLKSEHIKGPLFVDGCMRLVSGTRINDYKTKMQERVKTLIPVAGQRVIPKVGVFKNMEGTVLSVDTKKLIAVVLFEKSSRVVEAPLNVVNLIILSDTPVCSISLLTP